MPDSGGVQKTVDNVAALQERIAALTSSDVLVGIPRENNARKDGPIGNAALAYIHEFGSPARNIPARPFMRPGVRNAKEAISKRMQAGAQAVLRGDKDAVTKTLQGVGMLARNAIMQAIVNPNPPFVPLKPATIRARLRKTQAGRRQIARLKKQGIPLGVWAGQLTASGNLNIQPLLDTLQMKNAITYVIRPSSGKSYGEIVRGFK